jgi:hypothetical protein
MAAASSTPIVWHHTHADVASQRHEELPTLHWCMSQLVQAENRHIQAEIKTLERQLTKVVQSCPSPEIAQQVLSTSWFAPLAMKTEQLMCHFRVKLAKA